jgi:hypothetical protein
MTPVFGELLSDRTGLKSDFDVTVDDKTYVIETVANFDIRSVSFEDGKLVFKIVSSLKNNLGELQIPLNVTKGVLHFYIDGNETSPKVLQNQKISFVTLEFSGNGTHTLEVTSESAGETRSLPDNVKNSDQIAIIAAVVGIVVAIGVGSTIAFYMKRKPKSQ